MNKYGQMAYTYYLYHTPTGKKYYGVRYANKREPELDLWNEYFSSSDRVNALIAEYGKESFLFEVRKKFESEIDAILWEDAVLHRIKAVERDDWLNQAYMSGPYYRCGSHKQETKDLIRKIALERGWKPPSRKGSTYEGKYGKDNPNFGKTRSQDFKDGRRDAMLGDKNPMFGKSPANKGVPQTTEQKEAQSLRMKGHKQSRETVEKRTVKVKETWRKKREAKLQSALI
jgi:hypothetical protein